MTAHLPRWLAATALLSGCNILLGLDDPAPASPVDATPPPPIDAADPLLCATGELSGPTTFDTTPAPDSNTSSCGGAGASDVALRFTAPATDYYEFSTRGSTFDTVLALAESCTGGELACSDNVGTETFSALVRKVERGSSLLVRVDGVVGARGAGTVAATPVACPNQDVEGAAFPVTRSTQGQGDDHIFTCGGAATGTEDAAFHWVPPADGLYAFRAIGEMISPAIAVHQGPRCSDPALGCNSGFRTAEVVRRLEGGEPVSVIVEGTMRPGMFSLDVQARTGACPEGGTLNALVGAETVVTATVNERTLAPSCGFVERINRGGSYIPMGDMTYALTTPTQSARLLDCNVEGRSAQPFVLYALSGTDCSGAETDCAASQMVAKDTHEAFISLRGDPEVPVPYTVVVASNEVTAAPITLTTSCFIAI